MKFWRAGALALALSLVGAASQAQEMMSSPGGWYLRLEGGWNHAESFTFNGNPPAGPGSMSFDDGYLIGGAVGWNLFPATPLGNFRVELNLDYRDNDIKGLSVAGVAPGSAGGDLSSIAGMVNGIFDLPLSLGPLHPYVGAGLGFMSLDANNVSLSGTQIINDTDTIFAAQGLAGVKYDLTSNWDVGLEYRFLNGFSPRFHTANNSTVSASNYQNHSILVSLTYTFAPPPPPPPPMQPAAAPPPPPPPPPAAQVPPGQFFIVFFDFDKSTITAAGRQVLDAAAAAYSQNHPVRIELTGYTDTVGTQKYNLGLSKRRAEAAHDYLLKKGVPDSAMDVAWKGKEDLRVPTPDGVREPQNRRVEINVPPPASQAPSQ